MLPASSTEYISCILATCRKNVDQLQGSQLYAYMLKNGSGIHRSLGNDLIWMLTEVENMCYAQQIFHTFPYRNESSWSHLISGYVKCGNSKHALSIYRQMQRDACLSPNRHTFAAVLKACGKLNDLRTGMEIHCEVSLKGFLGRDHFISSCLVDMYVKCGMQAKAQEVFDGISFHDIGTWNALITGYVDCGQNDNALKQYDQMKCKDIVPNSVTFLCCLKACKNIEVVPKGQGIHAEIERRGFLGRNISLGSVLVDMYAKCGCMTIAKEVFDKLAVRNAIVWTTLISSYVEHGENEKALDCLEQMQNECISPDALTFVLCLKACGAIGAFEKGSQIHGDVERMGLLKGNMFLYSALVDMYARCGYLDKAHEVVDNLQVRNTVLWNSLISGYVQMGNNEEALQCYELMQRDGVSTDAVTLLCCLQACGRISALEKGKEIHSEINRKGFLEIDDLVGCTLVDMYAKCGLLDQAQELFDRLPDRSAVSWNTLIAGYAEHGYGVQAINCFERMQFEGIPIALAAYSFVLKACGIIGAISKGQEIHREIEKKGFVEKDVIGNCIVAMYARWGLLSTAQNVFDKLPVQDIIAWNTLITGYAQHDENGTVFVIFDWMLQKGRTPDPVTFIVILNACSRIGLSDQSQTYLEAMSKVHGMIPTQKHQSCIFNVLGRTGQIHKAMEVIGQPTLPLSRSAFNAVLSACRNWGNMEFGMQAFRLALDSERNNTAAYVPMSHIFAASRENV